jgi:cleavage and polyadenylation specificity factor subunit 1
MHRTMKAAIMCYVDKQWTNALPLVLLGICTAYKDLQCSVSELIYWKPLQVPGELLVPAALKVETSIFIQQLCHHMEQLWPTLAVQHSSPATFLHKDLWKSTHMFLRQDAIHRVLEPPYSGPHKVTSCTDKTFKIVVRG